MEMNKIKEIDGERGRMKEGGREREEER